VIRVATAQQYQQAISQMLDQQAKIQQTQLQLSSGQKLLRPSDDPSASRQLMSLRQSQSALGQYGVNLDFAESRLSQSESVFGDLEDLLQRARELTIQAASGSQSDEGRKAIAVELSSVSDQLLALANSRDQSGNYLFAGFRSDSPPFSITSTGTQYLGDDGQRSIQIAADAQIITHDPGNRIFMAIPGGNGSFVTNFPSTNTGSLLVGATSSTSTALTETLRVDFTQATADDPVTYEIFDSGGASLATGQYQENMILQIQGHSLELSGTPENGDYLELEPPVPADLFSRISAIAERLEQPVNGAVDSNLLSNDLARALESLDEASSHLSGIRSELGSRLQMLDTQRQVNEDFDLFLAEQVSAVTDLDYTEAISRLNLQLVGLEAAQQAYVKVQGLSLFNYI
jgi:flagellar hook-associated protein 3 FlgL